MSRTAAPGAEVLQEMTTVSADVRPGTIVLVASGPDERPGQTKQGIE